MKTAQRARLQKLQQKCTRLDRQHRDKVSENDKLGTQIAQLEARWEQRWERLEDVMLDMGTTTTAGSAAAAGTEIGGPARRRLLFFMLIF